jgi:hypothetical protein
MVNRHPWYAELVHSRPPLGPNALRRTELVLEVLTAHGATADGAMAYAAVLDLHVFGSALQAAAEQTMRRRYGVTEPAQLTDAIRSMRSLVTPDRYPVLAAWMADPAPAGADDQFRLGLACLLDGIGARLGGR